MLDGSFDRVLSRCSGGLTQGAVIFEVRFVEPLVGRRVIWEGLVDSCIGEDIVRITVHERRFDVDDGAGFLREIRRVADFARHEVNHRAQDVLFGWVFLRLDWAEVAENNLHSEIRAAAFHGAVQITEFASRIA